MPFSPANESSQAQSSALRRGPVPFLPVFLKVYQKVLFTSKCPSRHASILLFPFHLLPPSRPTSQPYCTRGIARGGEGRAGCQSERNRRERKKKSFKLREKPESLLVPLQREP